MASVTVLGGTGRLGVRLVDRLLSRGHRVIAVGRDAAKLTGLPPAVEPRVADFTDMGALTAALDDARLVASCGNAVFVPAVIAALPRTGVERLVQMGSTRRFSAVPDRTADAVRSAEAAIGRLDAPAVMLLATTIYGAGVGVIDAIAKLMRRVRIVPMPIGPRMQPIHIDDVAACLEAALFEPAAPGPAIVIAGAQALTYPEMASIIAARRGIRSGILPMPVALTRLAGRVAGRRFGPSLLRLAEDRVFDIAPMRERLGVVPRAFQP